MCFAIASIVAWRWSKHGLKETTMAAGDGAKTAEDPPSSISETAMASPERGG